jgi:hypothetical protein
MENEERWEELCHQAALDQDPQKDSWNCKGNQSAFGREAEPVGAAAERVVNPFDSSLSRAFLSQ